MTVFGVRDGIDPDIVALECFDKGFCHSVGLRAADRRRARLHSDVHQHRFRVLCNEARAVVGEPFNRLGNGVDATEAFLDIGDDKLLNVFALDALGGCDTGDGVTITAVKSKGNADFLCVVAANFKVVRTSAQVRVLHGNKAVMATTINGTVWRWRSRPCNFISQ